MFNSQLGAVKFVIALGVLLVIVNHFRANAQTNTQLLVTPTPQTIVDNGYKNAKFLEVVKTNDKVSYNKNDLLCLAKNIYHEAGNQPTKGKFAVAQVTINRTRDPKFEGTVCQVVMARNQFSWTNNHNLRLSHPSNEQWNECVRVADAALTEGLRVKGMENALYYHANYVHPHWRHVVRFTQIGAHIFYNRA